jgi:hypothetical protein
VNSKVVTLVTLKLCLRFGGSEKLAGVGLEEGVHLRAANPGGGNSRNEHRCWARQAFLDKGFRGWWGFGGEC